MSCSPVNQKDRHAAVSPKSDQVFDEMEIERQACDSIRVIFNMTGYSDAGG
jgi:hypothetical protein